MKDFREKNKNKQEFYLTETKDDSDSDGDDCTNGIKKNKQKELNEFKIKYIDNYGVDLDIPA